MIKNSCLSSLHIIVHVGKCGGLSIRDHVIENLPDSQYIDLYGFANPQIPPLKNSKDVDDYLKTINKKNTRIVMGHFSYYGIHNRHFPKSQKVRYITMLRNPYARLLSHYNYLIMGVQGKQARRGVRRDDGTIRTIKEWIIEFASFNNYMSKFLYSRMCTSDLIWPDNFNDEQYEKMIKSLDKFYFIGDLERAEKSFSEIYKMMDLPVKGPHSNQSIIKEKKLKKTEIEIFEKYNKYDIELYRSLKS
ncbi:uncharacterized protein Dvar_38750 [Desulfosarcina variabilis str. Montpellier]|uniref:sulfotransferase family 2 domain-containing protein n=1 Tax=Desulfosarcina variabilis TaxID=2300 RepID=UPI003AFB7FA3